MKEVKVVNNQVLLANVLWDWNFKRVQKLTKAKLRLNALKGCEQIDVSFSSFFLVSVYVSVFYST